MKNILILIIILLVKLPVSGQVSIDKSVKSVSGDTLSIENLGYPADSSNLISLGDIQSNKPLFFSSALINDTFAVSIDSNLFILKKGLPLFITSTNENTAGLVVKVNGISYSVKKNNGYPISGAEVIPSKVCILVFNGNHFVFLNSELPKCPSSFAQPNTSYCIEKNERTGNFWTAMITCNSLGYRLCSWSEWYYACQKAGLGMTGLTNNWEWINNGQNEPTNGKVVGSGICEKTTHQILTNNGFYRCCLSY